ncbi:MAG: serine hydrolase, partial [Clostridia bacterium]|nr:serine hydrolase [Clostridia bacterium]
MKNELLQELLAATAEFTKKEGYHVYRMSAMTCEDDIETLELIPAARCQNVYSSAKSFAMTGVGILSDRGVLKVEDKLRDVLGDSFPEKPADPRWADVTVEHAICHRTGLPGGHLDID